ncbi:hypothetical protein, partial [Rossellomorea sp. BNER]|uniref:hypothetical protein n=1 Tax=Rossellomorea sp. BNER TaxID=2962031 RepID=UPI003AF233DA|nr:hypothetical protein [Rossellomorea sp. BNER]
SVAPAILSVEFAYISVILQFAIFSALASFGHFYSIDEKLALVRGDICYIGHSLHFIRRNLEYIGRPRYFIGRIRLYIGHSTICDIFRIRFFRSFLLN